MHNGLIEALAHYGYVVLFGALLLEFLALPLPGEIMMSYAGLLVFEGKLGWGWSILAAGAGSSLGMTVAYAIGRRLGVPFFTKYGSRFHLGPDKLAKAETWFDKYGNKLLLVAYYIPGVRHVTGYFSGVSRKPFRTFAIYAYTGAFVWTGVFISLGRLLGPKWEEYHRTINRYMLIGGVVAALFLLIYYALRKKKEAIISRSFLLLERAASVFHSFGKVKFLLGFVALVFLVLFALMVGLIQDLLAGEFAQFDLVTSYLVRAMDEQWRIFFRLGLLASGPTLLLTAVFAFGWIMIRGEDRVLETGFLLTVTGGGWLWERGLLKLFHRPGPFDRSGIPGYTFPSEPTLLAVVVFGFTAYLLVRHGVRGLPSLFGAGCLLVCALLVGLDRVYAGTEYPSDVAAGYVFGGVWVSLSIVLMEVFRRLKLYRPMVGG